MVPRMVGYIIGLTQMERTTAQASAKYFFGRLPWILFCTVTLYSVIGALSAGLRGGAFHLRQSDEMYPTMRGTMSVNPDTTANT